MKTPDIRKRVLSNGMTVILVHKPQYVKSFFLCAALAGGQDIVQKKGNEIIEHPAGCAHFLEHQMFRLQGEDVTEQFALLQASTNAFTSFKETAYYFQTTSSDIRPALELLLDFVQTLDIDEGSVQKEKGIILSEYDMTFQNPDQQLLIQSLRSLYLHHPLKTDILGTRESIENMSVSQLQTFYEINYDPSQLVLIGITGQDLDVVESWIEEKEKKYPSKWIERSERYYPEEPWKLNRETFEKEMDVSLPSVCVAYKMKPIKDPFLAFQMDQALELMLDATFTSLNPSYQEWIDQRWISSMCGAECDLARDHGYVLFYSQTQDPEAFVALVDSVVERIQRGDIDPQIFSALKAKAIASNLRSFDRFEAMAIDILRALQDGFSYLDHLKVSESLTMEFVKEKMKELDFSLKTVTTIKPKSSNL